MKRLMIIALSFWAVFATALQAEMTLLMGDEDGCYWCEKWTKEIGPVYPKTAEGKIAPLMRQDIHDLLPDGITLKSAMRFTPTFVLLSDGIEVSRLEGYPGEDFFWGLLAQMIKNAQIEKNS